MVVSLQTRDVHRGGGGRSHSVPDPIGSAGVLPAQAEEAAQEGDDEEDPAGARGQGKLSSLSFQISWL